MKIDMSHPTSKMSIQNRNAYSLTQLVIISRCVSCMHLLYIVLSNLAGHNSSIHLRPPLFYWQPLPAHQIFESKSQLDDVLSRAHQAKL